MNTNGMRNRSFVMVCAMIVVMVSAGCSARQEENEQLRDQAIALQNEQHEMALRLEAFEARVAELNSQLEALTPPPAVQPVPAGKKNKKSGAATVLPPAQPAVHPPMQAGGTPPAQAIPPPAIIPYVSETVAKPPVTTGRVSINAATTVEAVTSATPTNTEQAAYQKALAAFEKRRFDEATRLFDAYLTTYPNGKFAPNALYWKGECLYTQGKYADAIFMFKEVIARHAKHPKSADALLKSGMAYKRLGDAENAALHWRILQEDFPQSSAVKKAKQLKFI